MSKKDKTQNVQTKSIYKNEESKVTNTNFQSLKSLEASWIQKQKIKRKSKKKKRLSRSWYGDLFLGIFLGFFALFSAYPLVFTICNSLKPLSEIFIFPPKLFPQNPTFSNFVDLFNLVGNTQIPITKYFFNTLFITLVGTIGHVIFASLCAYPLAKKNFPGKAVINQMIVYSLMFSGAVTSIPSYLIISGIGLLDSLWSLIIPAFGYTLGLFLMRQFMVNVPDELLEAAKIDGAGEYRIFFQIVMPIVKPAWLTVIILLFQQLWSSEGTTYIFSEHLKPFSYALSQIVSGGIARTGTAAAVSVIMLIVPITVFIISQSRMIETMAHSGLK